MSAPWFTLALAAKLTRGNRRDALQALLSARPAPSKTPQVIAATPKRFVSLPKLLKPNAAIDAMLNTLGMTLVLAQEKGISARLDLSDDPKPGHVPALYLSHHTIESPAFATLRDKGTRIVHFKAADLPGRTSLDPMGFAGWSSLARKSVQDLDMGNVSTQEIDAFFMTTREQVLTFNQSKYAQQNADEALPERYVFVALQTIGDMVQRNAYLPMLSMLDMVVARFRQSGYQVVIKRHPRCRSRRVTAALRKAAKAPHVTISQGSIHKLLAGAEAVFTVNSGVGSESLIHETPLYCFGASDYGAVAHHIRSDADLLASTSPIRSSCSAAERRRFLYYYRNIHQFHQADQLRDRLSALIADSLR